MKDFIVYGVGQLGQLFAGGALRENRRVVPITRGGDLDEVWDNTSVNTPILVGVGEGELDAVLGTIPAPRREHVLLVQNELFPKQWTEIGIRSPTIGIIWLSKKKGRPVEIARPSTLFGPHSSFFASLHQALELPFEEVDEAKMHRLLVAKFAFILGINTLGLVENLPLGDWLRKDEGQVDAVLKDAVTLGEAHLDACIDADLALREAKEAMQALAHYPAKGRTAAQRLQRAIVDAKALNCDVKIFLSIAENIEKSA
ncbi:MAG: hypothetical protein GY822_19755 [Deltaproteobacteria bacterium]|nr:hypothetical protein [Deltaproteobacteria bacterium]